MSITRLTAALADRYRVERELGAGGMATVYLAHDLKHDRDVAIKVLHPDLGAALGAERFLSEIKTTAKLQHPHILPLLDSGDADGLLYYVMPYVAGETLRSRLERENQLPIDDAIRIAREIADALGAAHALGIIHRDIKPENVLLQGGHALVADFGIALAVRQAAGQRMTQTGLSLGTPQYMSPEQAMGEKTIDLRADIYALGAVTYEMLAGDPPFTGSSVQAIIAKAMNERPTPLHTVRDTVPAGVENAVLKALAKLPADRFASATAFGDALSAGVSTSSTSGARSAALNGRATSGSRRPLWIAAAALIAINALGAAWVMRRVQTPTALVMQRQLTFDGKAVGTAISRDGLWLAYVEDECKLVELPKCSYSLSVREVDGSQSVRIANMQYLHPDIRWSGDGKSVIFRGSQGAAFRVFVADRLGGSLRQIPVSPTGMTVLADGASLLTAEGPPSAQWFKRYDLGSLALLDSARTGLNASIVFLSTSPTDGTLAGVTSFNSTSIQLILVTATGKLLDSLTTPLRGTVRWAPDGASIVAFDDGEAGGADDLLQVRVSSHRFARARGTTILGQVGSGDGYFDISNTSRYTLVVPHTRSDIQVASLTEPGLRWRSVVERSGILANRVTFTPDGRGLVAGATDNLGENLRVFDMADGASHALTAYRGLAKSGGRWAETADYSPDGSRVVFARGNGANVDVAIIDSAGGRDRVIAAGTGVYTARWIDDGNLMLLRRAHIVLIDTAGIARDSLLVPDSLAVDNRRVVVNGAEHMAYFSAPGAKAILAADFRAHTLRVVARTPVAMYPAGWTTAGQLLLATNSMGRSLVRAQAGSLVRVDASSGALTTIGALPRGCHTVAVDRSGTRVACKTQNGSGDVWLATPAQP